MPNYACDLDDLEKSKNKSKPQYIKNSKPLKQLNKPPKYSFPQKENKLFTIDSLGSREMSSLMKSNIGLLNDNVERHPELSNLEVGD